MSVTRIKTIKLMKMMGMIMDNLFLLTKNRKILKSRRKKRQKMEMSKDNLFLLIINMSRNKFKM